MIGIIDYNAGNVKSVERALDALGCEYVRATSPEGLDTASKLIFPGVGDAQYAMEQLKKSGFDSFLKDKVAQNIPVLGICLGSQIIFDFSEEGNTPCLGLIPGKIKHFSSIDNTFPLKVPHMGWNNLNHPRQDQLVILATADYGIVVPAAVRKGSLVAVQFHPEKSGEPGLRLLKNFCFGGEEQ